MSDRDTLGDAPGTAPVHDTPAPEPTVQDTAASLSDDGFDFDDEEGDDTGAEAAERAGRERDERGRFAAQGEPEAGEGTGEEAAPDDQAGEGEPAKPEPQAAAPAHVEIDGHKIPVEEVRNGYLRQADYTRKTQALAERDREVQALRQQTEGERAELGNVLNIAVEIIKQRMPQAPDRALINTDPVEYMRQQAEFQAASEQVRELLGAQQRVGEQQTAEQKRAQAERDAQAQRESEAAQAARVQAARELQKSHPHLFTDEGFNKMRAGVEKHSARLGLSLQHFGQIDDPRAFPVIELALKQLDLEAARPAALDRVRAAPPIRPGTRQGPGTRQAQTDRNAEAAFRRNPTIDGAVATLDDSLFGV